jgi:8-oxo-dGTP pyrophosphatase MutT (NUDIX family)
VPARGPDCTSCRKTRPVLAILTPVVNSELGPEPLLSHAGGVVYRERDGVPEVLVVTSSERPELWVLPKGHIDPGETPQEAACREVREEAGVIALVERPLGDVSQSSQSGVKRIRYFLMRSEQENMPRTNQDERRQLAWLDTAAATERLSYAEARNVVRQAADILSARAGHPR